MKSLIVLKPGALKHATAQRYANACRCGVVKGPVPNPTLVAHGLARSARWHLTSHDRPRVALADLYVGTQAEAHRIARLFANIVGAQVELLDNKGEPQGLDRHPRTLATPTAATVTNARRRTALSRAKSAVRGTPWSSGRAVQRRAPAARPRPNPKGRVRNAAGDRWVIFGGKYVMEEGTPQAHKNLGHVRTFTATGKRGAQYGAMLYDDGRFHWVNVSGRGMGTVPFDLAQVSPARFAEGPKANPKGRNATAASMFRKLLKNTADLYADRITHAEHGRINRTLWDAIEARGAKFKGTVLKLWRDHHARSTNSRSSRSTKRLGRKLARVTAGSSRARKARTPAQRHAIQRSTMIRSAARANPSRTKGARAGRKAKRAAFKSRRVYRAAVATHRVGVDARSGALKRFGHYIVERQVRGRTRRAANPKGPKTVLDRATRQHLETWLRNNRTHEFVAARARIYRALRDDPTLIERGLSWSEIERRDPGTSTNPKLKPIHGRPGLVTNAHHNRNMAMRAFKAGMTAAEIAKAWPRVWKEDGGQLSQIYDSYFVEQPDLFETRYTITADSVRQEIAKHKARRTTNPKGRASTAKTLLMRHTKAVTVKSSERHGHGQTTRLVYDDGTVLLEVLAGGISKSKLVDQYLASRAANNPKRRKGARSRVSKNRMGKLGAQGNAAAHRRAKLRVGAARLPRRGVAARAGRGNVARHSSHGAPVAGAAGGHRAGGRAGARRAGVARKVGPTRNPSGQVQRAVSAFKRWQDREVKPRLTRMRATPALRGAAAELGRLVAVTYRSDKYDGKTKDHEHVFKQPLASLVTDPASKDLHIVRGRSRYSITPDGIKN